MGDWFYVCVRAHVCVLESWLSARPPTFCSVSPLCSLSRSLHFREGFYLSSTETLSSLHSERRKGISAPHLLLCLLLYTAGRQSDPVWEGCELLLKHKAVHSYLLYLVVAYKKIYQSWFEYILQQTNEVLCSWEEAQMINWKWVGVHPPLPDVFVRYQTKAGAADLYNKTNVKVSDESCRYARVYFGALCVSCLMTLYCVVASVPARKQANMHETDQSGRRKGISIERSVNLSYKIG